jgi:hypothetical protein
MIYTLDYLKKEAELIASYWNGGDEKFVDGTGEIRTSDDAEIAVELLEKIKEVEELKEALNI